MSPQTRTPRRRPGGRSARVARAVFDATIAILIEDGYDALTLESVATRAAVNKTTVYRRWHRKPNLVAQACLEAANRAIPIPDSGSVRDDLRLLLREVADLLMHDVWGAVARAIIGAAGNSPELRDVQRWFWEQRIRPAAQVIERAVSRGDLPAESDPEFLIEAATASLWMRYLVTGRPINDTFIDSVLDLVLTGEARVIGKVGG